MVAACAAGARTAAAGATSKKNGTDLHCKLPVEIASGPAPVALRNQTTAEATVRCHSVTIVNTHRIRRKAVPPLPARRFHRTAAAAPHCPAREGADIMQQRRDDRALARREPRRRQADTSANRPAQADRHIHMDRPAAAPAQPDTVRQPPQIARHAAPDRPRPAPRRCPARPSRSPMAPAFSARQIVDPVAHHHRPVIRRRSPPAPGAFFVPAMPRP